MTFCGTLPALSSRTYINWRDDEKSGNEGTINPTISARFTSGIHIPLKSKAVVPMAARIKLKVQPIVPMAARSLKVRRLHGKIQVKCVVACFHFIFGKICT